MPGLIRLRLLGPVQVERDGQLVRGFESRKALALLGYLALRGQPATRSHLADLLWPERPEARGRANLSVVLHNLTTLLPDCLAADRQSIALRSAPAIWVDVAAFEDLVGRATPEDLAAAVELYRDEFMTDIYLDDCPDFEIWLVRQREEWRTRVTDVLGALIAHHVDRQRHDQAVGFTRRLLHLSASRRKCRPPQCVGGRGRERWRAQTLARGSPRSAGRIPQRPAPSGKPYGERRRGTPVGLCLVPQRRRV